MLQDDQCACSSAWFAGAHFRSCTSAPSRRRCMGALRHSPPTKGFLPFATTHSQDARSPKWTADRAIAPRQQQAAATVPAGGVRAIAATSASTCIMHLQHHSHNCCYYCAAVSKHGSMAARRLGDGCRMPATCCRCARGVPYRCSCCIPHVCRTEPWRPRFVAVSKQARQLGRQGGSCSGSVRGKEHGKARSSSSSNSNSSSGLCFIVSALLCSTPAAQLPALACSCNSRKAQRPGAWGWWPAG